MFELRECKTFRDYLGRLEEIRMLKRVEKEISPEYEIAAGIRKVSDTDGPALLFENIKGFPEWRVVGGLYATKRLYAAALGIEADDKKIFEHVLDIYLNKQRIKPKEVSDAPVKEIILKGQDANLMIMPNMTWNDKDSGAYITPITVAKHPVSGAQNLTIERRQVRGPYECAVNCAPPTHTAMIWLAYGAKGEGMPVAGVLGAPPEVVIASQFKPPLGIDEIEIAGVIRGEPVEVVKCETIDVNVPANAEVIIEGICRPNETCEDGPYGEFTGDYVSSNGREKDHCLIMDVTAITMRKNPIYSGFLTGMPMTEDHWLGKYSNSVEAYRILREVVPRPEYLKEVDFTNAGAMEVLVVSIHKWSEDAPQTIIHQLLSSLSVACIIVVDEDINVYDSFAVNHAWATRVIAPNDVYIPKGLGISNSGLLGSKWGLDATCPMDLKEWYMKAIPPGLDKVNYV